MNYEATLTSKGQITIPAALRHILALEPGDKLSFSQNSREEVIVKKQKSYTLEDLMDILPKSDIVLSDEEIHAAKQDAWIQCDDRP